MPQPPLGDPAGVSFARNPLRRICGAIARWIGEQTDLLPPYNIYQGSDWEKRAAAGKFYLELRTDPAIDLGTGPAIDLGTGPAIDLGTGPAIDLVEIDGVTFGLLQPGETIRVRYTRGMRAINLDRFTGPPRPD